jgi:hypothetical protein
MTTSVKWFIGGYITTLLSAAGCEYMPSWKYQIFYFISTPAIIIIASSAFIIVNNAINNGPHDRRK